MNGSMSVKGQLSTTRYQDDKNGIERWYGRAFWIGEDLKTTFKDQQRAVRNRIESLTQEATSRKDGTLFRELLHRNNHKYKPSEFTKERVGVQQRKEKKKQEVKPWGIDTFNRELDKAFPEHIDWSSK